MSVGVNTTAQFLTTAANAPSGDFTVSFWLYIPTLQNDWKVVWGAGGNTHDATSAIDIYMDPTNTLYVYTPPTNTTITGPVMTGATWTHLALVGNTAGTQDYSLWVSGTEYTGTSTISGYVDGPVDLLGTSNAATNTLTAWVAAYKHWSVKLTANQVQSERWCYLPRYGTSLYCVAPLLHTGYVKDYSGNGNDFTAAASVTSEAGPPIAWGTGFSPMTGQMPTGGRGFLFGSAGFSPTLRRRRR